MKSSIIHKAENIWLRITDFVSQNQLYCFVMIVYFILHLPGITNPLIDEHAWRQTDTAAVARNFQEESSNILFPRVDGRGQFSGITGMEFPLYNYMIFLTNRTIGIADWHGRPITLLISIAGLTWLYLFVKSRYDKRTALLSVIACSLFPLWFYYARNVQPDMLMVTFSIAALYFAQEYTKSGKYYHFIWLLISFSLACLVKIPAVFVGFPILTVLGWQRIKKLLTWQNVLIVFGIVGLPNLLWYQHSAYLSNNFGLGQYYYGDIDLKLSLQIIRAGGLIGVLQSYILPFLKGTFVIYIALLFGIFRSYFKRDWIPAIWLGSIGLFLIIFSNKSFYHSYYSLPVIPVVALFLALGTGWLYDIFKKEGRDGQIIAKLLGLVLVFFMAKHLYQTMKIWYAPHNPATTKLEQIMDGFSTRNDLVASNWGGSPHALYYAHRKGWSLQGADFSPEALKALRGIGLKYAIVDFSGNPPSGEAIEKSYTDAGLKSMYRDQAFVILKIHD